jgi:VIT1/CCC1 family predicted Fe2+/Mn2+ transporter
MLFVLGAVKSALTTRSWWTSGLEVMMVGAFVALIAFLIGWLIEDVVLSSGSNMGGLH